MYKHIVLWKIKETSDPEEKKEIMLKVKEKLEGLPAGIGEIITFEVGLNAGDYAASFYDISLISVFENKASFLKYTRYPIHNEVVAYIQSVQSAEQIVDYEFN